MAGRAPPRIGVRGRAPRSPPPGHRRSVSHSRQASAQQQPGQPPARSTAHSDTYAARRGVSAMNRRRSRSPARPARSTQLSAVVLHPARPAQRLDRMAPAGLRFDSNGDDQGGSRADGHDGVVGAGRAVAEKSGRKNLTLLLLARKQTQQSASGTLRSFTGRFDAVRLMRRRSRHEVRVAFCKELVLWRRTGNPKSSVKTSRK